jgi:hypothetical protein
MVMVMRKCRKLVAMNRPRRKAREGEGRDHGADLLHPQSKD